ncbi:MAG: hypothetical protein QNJ05_16835 [Woeseiaceae bacterium]|nr:hypothetical protein [Woeseiaceae bacterium]
MHTSIYRLATVLLALSLLTACNPEPQDEVAGVRKTVEKLQQQYDDLMAERGGDPVEWAASDLENLGDWEYRVETLRLTSEEDFAATLNEFGNDRWEVIWLERTPGGFMVIMKKPSISLLSKIPLSQLGRFIIDGSGEAQ